MSTIVIAAREGSPLVERRHGREHVLRTVVELVNSGPEASGVESLGDLGALQAFVIDREITEVRVPTDQDLVELHDLRRKLYGVFAGQDEDTVAQRINELLTQAPIEPRLTKHDGLPYHVHYFPLYASLGAHLAADCGMTLSTLVADGDWQRLRVCRSDDCRRVLVDSTRNRVRLYCDSRRCGNRIHAASYRARKRASADELAKAPRV